MIIFGKSSSPFDPLKDEGDTRDNNSPRLFLVSVEWVYYSRKSQFW